MITTPPSHAAAELEVGDTVRLLEYHDRVPAGTEGRVVGFYRMDPPQTLVQFEHGSCPILDSVLQRIA